MQFTTLFSIVASAAFASAHVVANGESMGSGYGQDVVIFDAYHEYTDSCAGNATTTFGGASDEVGECRVFDESYATVKIIGRDDGYDVNVFLTQDCSSYDGNLLEPTMEQCYPGNDGDVNMPYLAYKIITV